MVHTMIVAEQILLLLLGVCGHMCTGAAEHHKRHSEPQYLKTCPSACECIITDRYRETVDINCRDRPSEELKLPSSLTSLSFINVTTALLQPSNIVPTSGGSDMIKIIYKRSGIKRLSKETFTKTSHLELLDLSENLINEIPQSVFETLTQLRVLNLTDNKLETLADGLLKNQEHLIEIYLASNYLESAYQELYSKCNSLRVLDLSSNNITALAESSPLNPSLEVLLLNNNKLTHIPPKIYTELKGLKILDLSNNEVHVISETLFQNLFALEKLDLQANRIARFPENCFESLTNLSVLNISKNPLSTMDGDLFRTNLKLKTLEFRDTAITQIKANLLTRQKRLYKLNASHNKNLTTIENFKFGSSNHLQYIDLSFGNLTVLPKFISHLEMVEELILEGNPWKCGCRSGWFVGWLRNHQHAVNTKLICDGSEDMLEKLTVLTCEAPEAINETLAEVLEFRSTVVLNCLFTGEPQPSITWVTPSGYIYHYYPDSESTDIFYNHPRIHLYDLEPIAEPRVKVLSNGSLEIHELLRQDAGIYTCIAINPVGNATSHIVVTLDRKTFFHIKIMCIIVGASCVMAVLMCTAVVQLIYWLCKKCGLVEEREKELMQLRENIEVYKSQQLESLRENYTQQVHKIKENCKVQVEWIRDSYQAQVKHIRDFRHYGSHQFTSIRDQYYDQMKKVRDYSTTQLGWVRENYVFQRNRIQKFSSHQVLRFRESYKYQQQTLNKILENLPSLYLDNCRGSSCGRSESSVFMESTRDTADVDISGIDVFVKAKLEEMTDPSVLDEAMDGQSIYYTPSELSESPQSPMKDLILKKHWQDYNLCPGAYSPDRPSTSYSAIPWLQDSPCHVFHCSQSGVQCPADNEFQVPRTLQSSTSLPEMPQVSGASHETAL